MSDERCDEMDASDSVLSRIERQVVSDVLDAWIEQREKGFDLPHDLNHPDGELSLAAAEYALDGVVINEKIRPLFWPWRDWYKPKSRKENLLRAAAFLLSEISAIYAREAQLDHEAKEST